jgi:Dullard-like phosphatase family protein
MGDDPVSVQESALVGLRRRLAQQRQAIDASNTIVGRIRRRNDSHLDENIRRNAAIRANQAAPMRDTVGALECMLTQVQHCAPPVTAAPTVAAQPGAPSLPLNPRTTTATPPSYPRPGGPRRAYVDEARLLEWRRKPKNLSPAASLHLHALLPPPVPEKQGKICLVLDIDETLVHASFNTAKPFDTRLTIETETERGYLYVAFRPKLKEFLDFVAPLFEVVIFTASMSVYAEQLMNQLDPQRRLGHLRLFREHCTELRQARVKDLALLGRPLDKIAIIDNSNVAYLFQPRNAIPIVSWFDDRNDREFDRLMPMLAELAKAQDVYEILDVWNCTVH